MMTVFLSSTSRDLSRYRDAVYEAIVGLDGFHCVRMEDFGARHISAEEFCRQKIAMCDLFVCLVGLCYGSPIPGSEDSYTILEYRSAVALSLPRLIFVSSDEDEDTRYYRGFQRESDELWEKQQAFRQEVGSGCIRETFIEPHDLARKVVAAIRNWEREHHPITDPKYFEQRAAEQPFDQTICSRASLADLDLDKVSEFLGRDLVQRQDDFRPRLSKQDQLVQLGLLRESHPTYGALLCFSPNPQTWLAGAIIRCIYWRGNTRHSGWHDNKEYRGDLLAQFDSTIDFFRKNLRFSRIIGQQGRTEQYEIPLLALQEAAANALMHREYSSRRNDEYVGRTDYVQVEVFDNRIEIKSPGPLPPPMTLDVLHTEDTSHPRNPLIARIFYLYGHVERVGSGIQRMLDAMEDMGLPQPQFELSNAQTFKVIFERPQQVADEILQSDEFARLLTLGLEGIAAREKRLLESVIGELNASIGLKSPSLVRKWQQGRVPAASDQVAALARICVQTGQMDQTWLRAFLLSARYPSPELLITELFHSSLPIDFEWQLSTSRDLYRTDWGEAPALEQLYGRDKERAELEQWIVDDHCRMIALLGIGGVGKTVLAASVAKQVKDKFDYVFWRSLQNAPTPESILKNSIQIFSDQRRTVLPEDIDYQISLLIECLREHRCLLVLDNVETVLQYGNRTGKYRKGFEEYGRLIQRVGEVEHQSCLLLTSREKPKEVVHLEGKASPVRSLPLLGLEQKEGRELLKDAGLLGSDETWSALIQLYSGNPLALKLACEPIRELFGGDIASFLRKGKAVFGDIRDPLDLQFSRLSEQEREIMYWLAIEREAVSWEELSEENVHSMSKGVLLESLDSLRRRFMIESTSTQRFTLQPVIMEYVTDEFIEQIREEIETERIGLFGSHALIKAQAKDYVRNSQVRLILAPVAEQLLTALGKEGIEKKLSKMLSILREMNSQKAGYAAGNTLNLLVQLQYDLHSYDFSHLTVWQAYLQGVALPDVNFKHANLATSVFTDTFGSIFSLALSPKGKLLAAGTANSEIRLWQTPSGTPLLSCQGHTDWVRSVAFSSDGSLLASGSDDQMVRLWEVSTGQCLKILQGHNGWVRSVAFSSDGSLLASGSEDLTVRLWEVSTGQCLKVLQGHSHRVYSIAFSPDGTLLASGSHDQTVRLWGVSTSQCLKVLQGHTDRVRSVAFSPDGTLLASGSDDQMVRLWEVSTGQCLKILQGHSHRVYSIAFSSDGNLLASGSHDQTVRLWEVSTGQCLKILQGHTSRVWSVAFDRDRSLLASGSENQTVRLWEVDTGQCLKVLQGHSAWIYSIAFSPDGNLLASGSEDQTVRLWEVSTGQYLKVLQGHTNRVNSVSFSPDGSLLASGGHDQLVRLWEVSTGQCLKILQGHNGWVRSVAFSPDGNLLASGSHDQTVRLWEVSTGQYLKDLQGHTSRVWSVSFSPDGSLLASGGHDQTIRLWEVSTGQCLKVLQGHSRVRTVAFSPDGSLLASGSEDQMVRLWEVSTGQCLKILQGHDHRIYSVAFDRNGSILASGSHDGTIKLWNVQAGTCLKTLRNDRPYERVNITDVRGLTEAQKATLRTLGAIDDNERVIE